LGCCYESGIGVDEDKKIAVEWFRKAAEQKFAPAEYYLGYCYESGIGVDEDKKIAVDWFRKAAEQGSAESQFALYLFYYRGEGVAKDRKEAYKWCQKAADQGYERAVYYSKGVRRFYTWSQAIDTNWKSQSIFLSIFIWPVPVLVLWVIFFWTLYNPDSSPLLIYTLGPLFYKIGFFFNKPKFLFLGATLVLVSSLIFIFLLLCNFVFGLGLVVWLALLSLTIQSIYTSVIAISKSLHLNDDLIKYTLVIFLLAFLPYLYVCYNCPSAVLPSKNTNSNVSAP